MTEKEYWDKLSAQREREHKQHIILEAIRKLLAARLSYIQKLKAISVLVGMVDSSEIAIEP